MARAPAAALLGLAFAPQAALADDPSHSAIRELTLSLDVPQVPRSEQPFVRMRDAAIARMERALRETVIEGVDTTIDAALELIATPEFRSGRYDITFIPRWLEASHAAAQA